MSTQLIQADPNSPPNWPLESVWQDYQTRGMVVYGRSRQLRPTRVVQYKSTPSRPLWMHVFEPAGHKPSDRRPCFVAIHGGGWSGGSAQAYYAFADAFARAGAVGISLEYRLLGKDSVTPFECAADGRSAARFIKSHADQLGVDPDQLVMTGGSAGAHVASASAYFPRINEPSDDVSIDPTPRAVALYFPVIDTSSAGYGNGKCGPRWEELSPLHNVRPGRAPTILFHSRADTVTPYLGASLFERAMKAAGNTVELVTADTGPHGHILYQMPLFENAIARTLAFARGAGVRVG